MPAIYSESPAVSRSFLGFGRGETRATFASEITSTWSGRPLCLKGPDTVGSELLVSGTREESTQDQPRKELNEQRCGASLPVPFMVLFLYSVCMDSDILEAVSVDILV